MRNGIRHSGVALVCFVAGAAAAQPVDRPYEDLGCARLEAIVYEQVLASRYGMPATGSIAPAGMPAVVQACASTARTVSAGYTKAMSRLATAWSAPTCAWW